MYRPTTCPIEASNIALLGSDLEKKIKAAAAQGENAWHDPSVGRPGFNVWRIEKFTVKAWPQAQWGKFYKGDSYIVLHSYVRPGGNATLHDVHFWLGEQSTQDEIGTAAYKTVELDDFLGGAPVQHREVQGHESKLFLSYFAGESIELLDGGIDSGFHHVEAPSYQPRLLWVKGRGNQIRVTQVPLASSSLNSGDVFILDLGLRIHQWNGRGANFNEKVRAGQVVRAMRDERGGKPEAFMHSEGDTDLAEFWTALGGEGAVATAAAGGDDAAASEQAAADTKLFRLSDASGSMTFNLEHTGRLSKTMLDPKDVFIVDSGAQVFVWIGKLASAAERKGGMQYAQKYLTDFGRPTYMPISRVIDGGESDVFEMCFADGAIAHATRDIEGDSIKHACCPHNVAGGASWASNPLIAALGSFAPPPSSSSSSSSGAAAPAGGSRPSGGRAAASNEQMVQLATQAFGFFSNKVTSHLFR